MIRKFYTTCGIFALILIVLVMTLGMRLRKTDPADYLAAMADKHHRLENLQGPRLILAGGSNLAFGINSHMLDSAFSVPVVNLGLHAGLGLEFILNELKSEMRSGDVILISLEYFMSLKGDYQLKHKAAEFYPSSGAYFEHEYVGDIRYRIERKRNSMQENLSMVKQSILQTMRPSSGNKESVNVYRRACFNEYGDEECQLNGKSSIRASDIDPLPVTGYNGIPLLNEFYKEAIKRNVMVYFLYPNFPESVYVNNIRAIQIYAADISGRLSIPVLNTPEDMVFSDSLFYDTVYHLNGSGRNLRTEGLIRQLKQAKIFSEKKAL